METNGYDAKSAEMIEYPNLMRWYTTKMLSQWQLKAVVDEFKTAISKTKR